MAKQSKKKYWKIRKPDKVDKMFFSIILNSACLVLLIVTLFKFFLPMIVNVVTNLLNIVNIYLENFGDIYIQFFGGIFILFISWKILVFLVNLWLDAFEFIVKNIKILMENKK